MAIKIQVIVTIQGKTDYMTLICHDWQEAFFQTMETLTTLLKGYVTRDLDLRINYEQG